MELSLLFLKKFKDTTERILHVPGNFTGPVLEMAVVLDGNLSREQAAEYLPQLLATLKRHSEVFRNVRLNVVNWCSDDEIVNQVCPLSMVLLKGYYENYAQKKEEKTFEVLVEYLKKYQARAKLIILLTDGNYEVRQEELLEAGMRPFLDKKLMQVVVTEEDIPEIRYRFKWTV